MCFNNMLSFYVCWDKKTEKRYGEDIPKIVNDSFRNLEKASEVKIPVKYVGSFDESCEYGNPEWYLDKAFDPARKQVNSKLLWELFKREPWQNRERHFELFIHSEDMYTPGTSFIFGETRRKISFDSFIIPDESYNEEPYIAGIIISTNRLENLDAFEGILYHEEGHFYGLPSPKSPDYINWDDPRAKTNLEYHHCNNPACIMEQVNVPGRPDILTKTKYVKKVNSEWFCDPDSEQLKTNLKKLYL